MEINFVKFLFFTIFLSLSLVGNAQKSNVEIHITEKYERSYARLNLFTSFPGKINDYTFVDFNESGFFLRNIMTKNVFIFDTIKNNTFSFRFDTKHGNKIEDHFGIGFTVGFKIFGGNSSLSLMPVWLNFNEISYKRSFGTAILTFQKEVSHPKLNIKTQFINFWEFNFGSQEWGYGESYVLIGNRLKVGFGINCYQKEKDIEKKRALPEIVGKLNLRYIL